MPLRADRVALGTCQFRGITRAQLSVLEAIQGHRARSGCDPSFRQIAAATEPAGSEHAIARVRIRVTSLVARGLVTVTKINRGSTVAITEAGLSAISSGQGASRASVSHGMWRTAEYKVWQSMIGRCVRPLSSAFAYYGGRGIRVAPAWQGSGGFARFIADVGRRPSNGHTLDRIDNDGNYEPGNVRWATRREQNLNRRNTKLVTRNGITLPLETWVERAGLRRDTVDQRLSAGWDIEKALTVPSQRDPSKRVA